MSKKVSAPRGSTRKEMTQEEKDWLKNFDQAFYKRDEKALAKIVPKDKIFTDVIRQQTEEDNARRGDIFHNQKAVNIQPNVTSSWDESFDSFIEGDSSPEHHVEDPTLAPKYDLERYTPEDYNPPSFPDEDALIVALDHDRDQFEKSKVKNFSDFVQRYKKGKGHGQAS